MQYLLGKNNDVRFRLVRRSIHENNAEISNLLSLMTKEPKINKIKIETAFRFLTLNHTLIAYLSTLSSHRDKKISSEILKIIDETANFVMNTFQGNENLKKEINQLKNDINALIEHKNEHVLDNELLVLQQILLMSDILPETANLVNKLIFKLK